MESGTRLPRGVGAVPCWLDDPWEECRELLAGAAREGFDWHARGPGWGSQGLGTGGA